MLKLNIGFNRKVGESNYGSRGASVNLELDFSSELASDPDRLKERIRHLFGLAKASVDEELNHQASNGHSAQAASSNGNGKSNGRRDSTRRATASQARALRLIAERQGVDLQDVMRRQYSVDKPEDLSITEASELIDQLKAQASGNGSGGRR